MNISLQEKIYFTKQLFTALGLKSRGRWNEQKPTLIGLMVQCGTKFQIVDDTQDLSLEHLMFIKEVTDQGRLQHGYPLGLCLSGTRGRVAIFSSI